MQHDVAYFAPAVNSQHGFDFPPAVHLHAAAYHQRIRAFHLRPVYRAVYRGWRYDGLLRL